MTWQFQPYLIILICGIGMALFVAAVAWRRRDVPGAVSMTGLMLAVAWWLLMAALEIVAADRQTKILCSQLLYLGVATVPVWWFLFALDYSGVRRRLPPRAVRWLWLIPALTILVALTQGWHSWLWSQVTLRADGMARYEYGWWFLIHAVYSYALIAGGIILLIRTVWQLSRSQWRQVLLLTVASLFPLVLNIIYLTGRSPVPDLDLTAVGFAVAGAVMVWNVLGFHLFDLSPVARDLLVESLDDGVIVLDRDNHIVDINPAGQRLIGAAVSPIGQSAEQVFSAWPDLVAHYRDVEQAHTEIRLDSRISAEPMYIELRISPLRNRRGGLVGRLVTLHDVTKRRETEMRLRQLSRAVEQSSASIMITDLEGRIQYINPKFTELTQYEPHEVIGQPSNVLKSGETSPEEYARLWRTIQAGGEWRGEFHNRKKNGELYWESAVISPITDTQGRITFFLAVKEDISARKQAEAVEQRRAQRQALVSDISMAINLSKDVQAVMQAAVDGLTRVLETDEVGLALYDETREYLLVQADHPAPGNQSTVGIELPLAGNLSMQRVVETRRPLMILDAQHDPLVSHVHHVLERQQVQSILLVPLIVRDEVIGTIGVDALNGPRAFSDEEIDLAQTVANLVAVRIEQARLFEAERAARQETHRHMQDLSGLYAVTRATSRSLAVEDVVSQALTTALTSLQFEAGLIVQTEAAGMLAGLHITAERGLTAHTHTQLFDLANPASLVAYTFRQREVLVINSQNYRGTGTLQPLASQLNQLGWQTAIGIPLLHRDDLPLGVMCMLTRRPRAASPIDMALFASMGHQVAAAISNAQLFQTTLNERSRLKALIESSRDGIVMTSVDGTILVMNAPALTLLRLSGAPADWVNRSILDAIREMRHSAPQAARAAIAELRRLQTAAEPTVEGDYEVTARPIHWQSLPVRVGSRPMGRLIVMRDMTEEQAIEQMRDDMTHTMVHDLRNPLTGIFSAVNMVLDGTLGKPVASQRQVLEIARTSAERMMKLVTAILDVSRLESGRMPVTLMVTDPIWLLQEALHGQAALARERQIQLDHHWPDALPLVRADTELIQRVLQNLLGNAIKFTPEHGRVLVTASRAEDGDGSPIVLIAISDTGPGISPEIQSRLFQKFVTGGQQERGSGLGLAFCKLAVEAHGQRIWVESAPGQGTTSNFSLAALF
jgi:PAS domain S-box-containing protein